MTLIKTSFDIEEHLQGPEKISHIDDTLIPPSRVGSHQRHSGINPIVDAAASLFSFLGKLKSLETVPQISVLQAELIKEINLFQNTIKQYDYPKEYIAVCQFVLCATVDETLAQTQWDHEQKWENHLLKAFNQDTKHEDKFFTLMERIIREPSIYIDLMELMYICLSMGYKGQFKDTTHGFVQLDQIMHHLYKHIQAHRGHFNKTLSPTKSRVLHQKKLRKRHFSLSFIFIVTACMVMMIFVSLGYLMDVVSHEASKTIIAMGNTNS